MFLKKSTSYFRRKLSDQCLKPIYDNWLPTYSCIKESSILIFELHNQMIKLNWHLFLLLFKMKNRLWWSSTKKNTPQSYCTLTLNLYSNVCQLFINKTRKIYKTKKKLKNPHKILNFPLTASHQMQTVLHKIIWEKYKH